MGQINLYKIDEKRKSFSNKTRWKIWMLRGIVNMLDIKIGIYLY